MSFKFPSFNLQTLQESLPTVDQVRESFAKVNPSKTVDQFRESIQPFANKTTQLVSAQLQQVQHLANLNVGNANVEVSELPAEYLKLEANCDLLLKLYTDLITYTNETYDKVSYDYPPGNYAITKIKEANVGGVLSNKFNQLKNVSSPQELEKILMGKDESSAPQEEATIQVTSAAIPKTLYGQLSVIAEKHSEELKDSENPVSLALLQLSSTYLEIASARLAQDKIIVTEVNHKLVEILNEQFIKVNELRKKVYSTRSDFDLIRASVDENDQENEELISKEDELVSATEVAVVEMKKLLRPSKNINLLKVFVDAQKEFFELSAKKLAALSASLAKIETPEEEDDY
ncbi:Golgi vesicle protein [Scheffersomyces xylosifermentans]|uniref:Golgi vesicle protein n=1 Tax=Scheffersomyces xylosifermentans TaxID=1304137 RepID=UPI00315D17CA